MKIEIVGAGPGGLYLAILLKKAGAADVRVLERNAPDATFGWGVVFSEETLGALRDADPSPTSRSPTPSRAGTGSTSGSRDGSCARRATRSRRSPAPACSRSSSGGPATSASSSSSGVEVEELPDPDLIVGADGANSLVRGLGDFGTKVEPEGSKYVWFGTDLVFDAFTFIFKETEHGLLNVHAYPYDERMSTFIVECPEPVWRAAGLDAMDEQESLAFCEQLFARDLRGRELLTNRSLWLDFPKVTNRVWHDGRVVLLGDAAHTAHFSIGSGTNCDGGRDRARERARAARLGGRAGARGLRARADACGGAHAGRGQRQRGVLRADGHLRGDGAAAVRLQPAHAQRADHAHEPRDPGSAVRADLDSWFGGREVSPPPAFSPFGEFPNRFSLVPSGFVAVSEEGRISPETPVIREWVRPDGPVLLQLGHAGRRGSCRSVSEGRDLPLADGWPVVAPTPQPYGPFSQVPAGPDESLTLEQFVAAAEVDVDVLELDMAHGYLLGSYLSPLTNPEEDRLRFPLQVLEAVRKVRKGPLAVRLSVTDWHPRGNSIDDGIAIARAMREPAPT